MKNTVSILLVFFSLLFLVTCSENKSKKTAKDKPVNIDSLAVVRGSFIADASFKVLKGELMNAINKGGPVAGVEICSSRAMRISDSLSEVYGVNIKRTSVKNRNPQNIANNSEREILLSWENDMQNNKPLTAKVLRADNGEVQFMAPIKTAALCLNCHGDFESMNPELKEKILEKYPADLAHGYGEGQLRGAWSITFPKAYFDKEK